jgi:alkanesulfonate monooxygenase SsuD/methylene tetrahydromethanopterin reductase-like flavin-dependent oxidoreductase (luciferase family)
LTGRACRPEDGAHVAVGHLGETVHGAVGVPATERGARTDDHLAAARALWSQKPADFDGQFTTLRAAYLGVPPVTPGGPPVWVGGHSDAALRRALRFGDGWYGTGVSAAGLTDVRRRLHELADGAGNAGRLTLASAAFFTPPGIAAAMPSPGPPLGGAAPTTASVVDNLGHLAEAGSSPARCGCLSRPSTWRRRWTGPQPRSCH